MVFMLFGGMQCSHGVIAGRRTRLSGNAAMSANARLAAGGRRQAAGGRRAMVMVMERLDLFPTQMPLTRGLRRHR